MTPTVLNMLPLMEDEHLLFEACAPGAIHDYAQRNTVTPQQLQAATIILGWPKAEELVDTENLQWLHSMWSGVDEYIHSGNLSPHTTLTTSSGANSQSVAEHMLASLLAVCRKLHLYRDNQNQHLWRKEGELRTISGATVVVIGTGNIGRAFAVRCQALGAHTVGFRRSQGPLPEGFHEVYTMDALEEWLPNTDVLALALPHNGDSVGLITAKHFQCMKEGSILVNAGRGTVLDQDALMVALNTGKLFGAAVDVTDPEHMPPEHPLWRTQNLLITPHVGGGLFLEMTRKNIIEYALENLGHYLRGEPLRNLVHAGDYRPK